MLKEFVNLNTLIAFVLGVFMAAWVKMLIAQAKGKVAG